MDQRDFEWPNTTTTHTHASHATPPPPPASTGRFGEHTFLVWALIGIIIILVIIVAYMYFSAPKETVQTEQSSSPPQSRKAPRKTPPPPPPVPEEPPQVDPDGLLKSFSEARSRRKEEIAAAKMAEPVDDVIVTDGAVQVE